MPKARSGTIYFQHKNSSACTGKYHRRCTGRWRGEITVDGGRRKVSGSSRQEVADKLDKLRAELPRASGYELATQLSSASATTSTRPCPDERLRQCLPTASAWTLCCQFSAARG